MFVQINRPSGAKMLRPLINMGTRAFGLIGRFGLTIYMARFIPLNQIGDFGLIAGLSALMPPISGLGLNYFLGRELVGMDGYAAGKLIRDRLLVTIIMMTIFEIVAATTVIGFFRPLLAFCALSGFIVFFDTLATDFHTCLLSLRKPILANTLLFVRTAAWVFPVIACGIFISQTRSVQIILMAWCLGLICYFISLAIAFRSWPLLEILKAPLEWRQIFGQIRGAWLIYFNDLGVAGSLYLSRYTVALMLGMRLAGSFTLLWMIVNGINVLITTAVRQLAAPKLVSAFRVSEETWCKLLINELFNVASLGVAASIAGFICVESFLPRLGIGRLGGDWLLLLFMLIGTVVRLLADLMDTALFSRHLDRELALTNIGSLVLTLGLDVALMALFGIHGAGFSMIIVPFIVFGVRLKLLDRHGSDIAKLLLPGISHHL